MKLIGGNMENDDIRCEMAIAVLQETHDGEDLDPAHLWLVQEWVNDHLNEKGEATFRELHAQVTAGKYQKPWLHGVEHLTRDHQGYVFWKCVEVEHYSFSGKGAYEREKTSAEELGRRCRILESKGIQPTCKSAIWGWKKSQGGK
jgi:hypothetical protein